jgi:hypothetical protein
MWRMWHPCKSEEHFGVTFKALLNVFFRRKNPLDVVREIHNEEMSESERETDHLIKNQRIRENQRKLVIEMTARQLAAMGAYARRVERMKTGNDD